MLEEVRAQVLGMLYGTATPKEPQRRRILVGMNHKMVNLCDASYDIASRMENYSGWVRAQTIAHDRTVAVIGISQMTSKQLMAVVLARQQSELGFLHDVTESVLKIIQDNELVG